MLQLSLNKKVNRMETALPTKTQYIVTRQNSSNTRDKKMRIKRRKTKRRVPIIAAFSLFIHFAVCYRTLLGRFSSRRLVYTLYLFLEGTATAVPALPPLAFFFAWAASIRCQLVFQVGSLSAFSQISLLYSLQKKMASGASSVSWLCVHSAFVLQFFFFFGVRSGMGRVCCQGGGFVAREWSTD